MMKFEKVAMAFYGPANSGKTTLITKIADNFIKNNFRVGILKYDFHDEASFDIKRKDSFKFYQTGADVIVSSHRRTTFFSHSSIDVDDCMKLGNYDVFLVEGLRSMNIPRIAVFHREINRNYLKICHAVASKQQIFEQNIKWLNLDNIDEICEHVLKYGKRIN